jgi:hypothetical protein
MAGPSGLAGGLSPASAGLSFGVPSMNDSLEVEVLSCDYAYHRTWTPFASLQPFTDAGAIVLERFAQVPS